MSTNQTTNRQKAPRGWQVTAMGVGLVLFALLLAHLFQALWPAGVAANDSGSELQKVHLFREQVVFTVSFDVRLILLVMVAGALGSFIHVATSFADYVGNNKLVKTWMWWYLLRPFIGMLLAVIFYVAIRGGFLSTGTQAGNINPFGIAALAGLVGMFSKQASDKLNEMFNTLFRTEGDARRKDNLANPVPSISDIEPKQVESLTNNVIVTVTGTGFVKGAAVQINGTNRETEFVDETQLTAKLLEADVAQEGELKVTVINPPPGGGASPALLLKIMPKTSEAAAPDTSQTL